MLNTQLIKIELIKIGKTQTELAKYAGTSRAMACSYINNTRRAPLKFTYKLAQFLNKPMEALLLLDAA